MKFSSKTLIPRFCGFACGCLKPLNPSRIRDWAHLVFRFSSKDRAGRPSPERFLLINSTTACPNIPSHRGCSSASVDFQNHWSLPSKQSNKTTFKRIPWYQILQSFWSQALSFIEPSGFNFCFCPEASNNQLQSRVSRNPATYRHEPASGDATSSSRKCVACTYFFFAIKEN